MDARRGLPPQVSRSCIPPGAPSTALSPCAGRMSRARGGFMAPTPPPARILARLLLPCLAAGTLLFPRAAFSQTIQEPPQLPVVIVVFPSMDGMEAEGFDDGSPIDLSVIRNGNVVGSIT